MNGTASEQKPQELLTSTLFSLNHEPPNARDRCYSLSSVLQCRWDRIQLGLMRKDMEYKYEVRLCCRAHLLLHHKIQAMLTVTSNMTGRLGVAKADGSYRSKLP